MSAATTTRRKAAPDPVDARGRIGRTVPCAGCGYDLRNAAADGACPECGARVSTSLDPRRLVLADPRWVRGRATALFWFAAAVPAAWTIAFGVAWMMELVELTASGAGAVVTFAFAGLTAAAIGVAWPPPASSGAAGGRKGAVIRVLPRLVAAGAFAPAGILLVVLAADALNLPTDDEVLVLAVFGAFGLHGVALASTFLSAARLRARERGRMLARTLAFAAATVAAASIVVAALGRGLLEVAFAPSGPREDLVVLVMTIAGNLLFFGTLLGLALVVAVGVHVRRRATEPGSSPPAPPPPPAPPASPSSSDPATAADVASDRMRDRGR